MNYYAGIDGGGTITKVAICDDKNTVLYQGCFPSINCYGIGHDRARDNLIKIFNDIRNIGFNKFQSVYIGSSSLIDKANSDFVKEFTEFINADKIEIVGDINIILNSLEKRPSAVIISGTGSIMGLIKSNNDSVYVGGLGHLIGDEGSAYEIGSKGIRLGFRSVEGWGRETLLQDGLYNYFNTNSTDIIIDKIYKTPADKSLVANFSMVVESCAANGDKVATEILLEAARELFNQFLALIKKAYEIPLEVILSGSVLTNSLIVREEFIRLVSLYDKRIACTISQISPEIRAMNLARRLN